MIAHLHPHHINYLQMATLALFEGKEEGGV